MSWDPLDALPPDEPDRSFPRRTCWPERHWLNVPGPFYVGMNDSCWTGRICAPANVCYGEYQGYTGFHNEYVYRQPRTPTEVLAVVEAAWSDPYSGYAYDGDEHWTPSAVREWWKDRGRVRAYVDALAAHWADSARADEREAAAGLREYGAYLRCGLAADLRRYLFRLEEGDYPAEGACCPEL
ncbi:hypothetical protein [Streptomyces sp. NBC_01190]|uniref:hypothetical protein n=1 Tax=Streptomyces sp. NBC_01190 TaxID=2903767 RepID=UPI003864A4D0|nr:hypothetical protein OG519_13015 [Streptomyces sp. NBC_01190]